MVPYNAPAELFGHERAEKDRLKMTSVSLAHSDMHFSSGCTTIDPSPGGPAPLWNHASTPTIDDRSSPISVLLEELLVVIFDDVITSESSSYPPKCKRTSVKWLSSPRNLASVSKMWKTIVTACPRLWRYVHLTPYQSIHALREQLHRSSPFPIYLTVHQWPFRQPNSGSGPFSVVALVAQLQSVLSPSEKEGATLAPASRRVESIAINATESSTFTDFVLRTWTGCGSKFSALRQVTMNGNVCATWSRPCFFDERSAPRLERLELSNVVIAHDAYRLSGSNLTTLVWTAPAHRHGSLVVSVSCFHHVVSSFPRLITLELDGRVVAFEFATMESLEESSVIPLVHVCDLRISGRVFPNAWAAYVLFHLLPSLRNVAVRGRAHSGPLELRTVTLALQGLIYFPKVQGWPIVLPKVESLEMDCIDAEGGEWKTWIMRELGQWREWREMTGNAGKVRMEIGFEEEAMEDEVV